MPLNNADLVGSFDYKEKNVKKAHQDPIDINKQVENLISLGLEIEDRNYAENVPNRVFYYRLIKAT